MHLRFLWSALALFGACMTMIASCAPRLEEGSAPAAPKAESLPWVPFRWVSFPLGDTVFDRAAVMVPITVEGLPGTYEMQLDLGAGWPLLNEAPYRQLLHEHGRAQPEGDTAMISGRISGVPVRDYRLHIRPESGSPLKPGSPDQKIGTLGLNFFRDRVLLIDFPGRRVAVLDTAAALPAEFARRAEWVDIEYRHGHLFVPITLNGKRYEGFFYDTGASIFPATMTHAIWKEVTGRTGVEPDNVVWRVPSWGKEAVMVGAPALGEVRLGSVELSRPLVFYEASGLEGLQFENWPYRVSGTIGNVLFADDHVVIVDIPRKRLGIIERR
jgi:hypothetical protein